MAKNKVTNCRLGRVGGQAVIEGVMMKSGRNMAIASRMPDGSILVQKKKITSARQKYKVLDLPIIRGVVNFVEMMKLSYTTMDASTAVLGLEDEEPSKFEKWLAEKLHINIMTVVMVIGMILGLGLVVALFIFLPSASGSGISKLIEWITDGKFILKDHGILLAVIEGIFKVAIFLLYLWLVSLMKDIRRVFEYHGAEHKSVFCYEEGLELMNRNPFANGSVIFTQSGYYAREFARRTDGGMVGVNVGIPVPIGVFPFSGHKKSFFGDLHCHGKDAFRFYTESKTVTIRWFDEEEKQKTQVSTWDGSL